MKKNVGDNEYLRNLHNAFYLQVLMAMNGVSNCVNLLSWLVTGLIFSISYTVPIVILLNFTSTEYALPYLYYGNSFLFWFVLTVHVGHLITFGMHISAYFTRCKKY